MAITIKVKRSETSSALPTASDLAVGEIAMNTADKILYTKDSAGNIIKLSNYAVSDPSLVFPTGDMGNLTSGTDAFGQSLVANFDNLTTPTARFLTNSKAGHSNQRMLMVQATLNITLARHLTVNLMATLCTYR